MRSYKWTINWQDFFKSLGFAVFVSALFTFKSLFDANGLSMTIADFTAVLEAGIGGGLAYLAFVFGENSDGELMKAERR